MRAKTPGIDISTYSKPTNLPGFLVELMCPRSCEFSRYLINAAGVSTGFFIMPAAAALREDPTPTERPHATFTLMRNLPRDHVKVIVPETTGTV
jgi:hypothetical protein